MKGETLTLKQNEQIEKQTVCVLEAMNDRSNLNRRELNDQTAIERGLPNKSIKHKTIWTRNKKVFKILQVVLMYPVCHVCMSC